MEEKKTCLKIFLTKLHLNDVKSISATGLVRNYKSFEKRLGNKHNHLHSGRAVHTGIVVRMCDREIFLFEIFKIMFIVSG